MMRERQLESAEISSMVVISRHSSTPLLWVQWFSGKCVQLVIGSLIPVDFSFFLSKATSRLFLHTKSFHMFNP